MQVEGIAEAEGEELPVASRQLPVKTAMRVASGGSDGSLSDWQLTTGNYSMINDSN